MTKLDLSAGNPTTHGAGTARTGAEARRVYEAALTEFRDALATALAAVPGEAELRDALVRHIFGSDFAGVRGGEAPTAEKVATGYRLELGPGQELVFRHRGDVITELVVREASS